jgi:hypothetical protein
MTGLCSPPRVGGALVIGAYISSLAVARVMVGLPMACAVANPAARQGTAVGSSTIVLGAARVAVEQSRQCVVWLGVET